MGKSLYGSGLRLMERPRLRVKALDFAQRPIIVRDGKGMEDRVTMLPESLISPSRNISRASNDDICKMSHRGVGPVYLPFALERKYPHAGRLWIWQCVFPSDRLSKDPRTGIIRRHHLGESALQKAVSQAGRAVGLNKHMSCHTFRHSFATQPLQQGYGIKTVQELLGHKYVRTTMISTHVLNRGKLAVRSPLA
jgi:site-specific recombinase XerD